MHAKSTTARYDIVIEHTHGAKVHPIWSMPSSKTETVMGIEPPVISMSPVLSPMNSELAP
jgi:hypothetical protein